MATLRETAIAGVEKAFALLAKNGLLLDINVRRVTKDDYNASMGKAPIASTANYPANAVKGKFEQYEVNGTSVLATDTKFVFLQSEVAAAGDITTSDKVVLGSDVYEIVDVSQDSIGATWVVQARK